MAKGQPTTRVPVALPATETAPERWLRNIRLSGFTATMLALIVIAVVVLAPQLRLLIEQQQEMARLRTLVTQQQDAVDSLNDQVARWSDPAFIESQARQRLLYVYPGEYSYLVVEDMAVPTGDDGTPISDKIQETRVDWVKGLLTSVLAAGLSTELDPTGEAPTETPAPESTEPAP